MGFEKMSAHRRSVFLPDHDVGMHLGLAFIERDVADQRDNLHLLVHLILQVIFLLQVKVPESRVAEGADRGEVSAADIGCSFANFVSVEMTSSPVSKIKTVPLSSLLALHRNILRPR